MAFGDKQSRGTSRAPVSTHPAFPLIVGLWFAALLGIGSLVLPVALFERLVTISGLSSAIPFFAPPLELAARLVIAAVAGLLGALAGLLIARQVARAHRPSTAPTRRERNERAPISAHDELGEDGFDGNRRRRGLMAATMEEPVNSSEDLNSSEEEPAAEPYAAGPAESEHDEADYAEAEYAGAEGYDGGEEAAAEPETTISADRIETGEQEERELEDAFGPAALPEDEPVEAEFNEFEERFSSSAFEETEEDELAEFSELPDGDDSADGIADIVAFEAPPPEPEARLEAAPQTEAEKPTMPRFEADTPLRPSPQRRNAAPDRRQWAEEPLEELSLAQLAERLALALQRRRENVSGQTDSKPAAPSPAGLDAAPPEEAAQAMAAYFESKRAVADDSASSPAPAPEGRREESDSARAPESIESESNWPGTPESKTAASEDVESEKSKAEFGTAPFRPAAMPGDLTSVEPLDFGDLGAQDDEDDESDLAASLSLPIGKDDPASFGAPAAVNDGDDETEEDEDYEIEADYDEEDYEEESDAGYSSLLALKNPTSPRPEPFDSKHEADALDDGKAASHDKAAELPGAAAASRPFDRFARQEDLASAEDDDDEIDETLRSALDTLRRMNGSA